MTHGKSSPRLISHSSFTDFSVLLDVNNINPLIHVNSVLMLPAMEIKELIRHQIGSLCTNNQRDVLKLT